MTLRVRVALLVAAVVAVTVAAVGWSAVRSARAELTEEVDNDLIGRATPVLSRAAIWSDIPMRRAEQILPRLRTDPLGALVSFDAYARVVVADPETGSGGVIRNRQVILTFDEDFGALPDIGRLERARRSGPVLETVRVGDRRLRMMTVEAADGVFVQVARPIDEVDSAMEDLRGWVLLVGSLAVAAAAAGGWFLAGPAVRPIVRLAETAEQITSTGDIDREVEGYGTGDLDREVEGYGTGDLDREVEGSGASDLDRQVGDSATGEVGRLARSFRTMLGALATSRRQQRLLVMDASHELRTPLTSLRTNVDLLRRPEALPAEERAAVLDDVDAELGELTDLVAELVDLAAEVRTDEEPQLIELADVAEAVAERARRRSGRDISVRVDRGGPLEGRPEALARAVRNLVDNAAKFSGDGPIEVVVDGGAVTVHDTGPGVPEDERERIFERFHRLEADRNRPGSGLGLAIVRQVAEAHGGTVSAAVSPLGGAAIGLRIPEIDD